MCVGGGGGGGSIIRYGFKLQTLNRVERISIHM